MGKPLGQTARIWNVLKDGRPHPMPELERAACAERCRVNSRVAEARKRFGVRIDCDYDRDLETWVYQFKGSALPEPDVTPVEPPSSASGSESTQPTLTDHVVETLRVAPELAPVVAAALDGLEAARVRGPVSVPSPLDDRDEEYASRLADRLRAEDTRLRLIRGGGEAA